MTLAAKDIWCHVNKIQEIGKYNNNAEIKSQVTWAKNYFYTSKSRNKTNVWPYAFSSPFLFLTLHWVNSTRCSYLILEVALQLVPLTPGNSSRKSTQNVQRIQPNVAFSKDGKKQMYEGQWGYRQKGWSLPFRGSQARTRAHVSRPSPCMYQVSCHELKHVVGPEEEFR